MLGPTHLKASCKTLKSIVVFHTFQKSSLYDKWSTLASQEGFRAMSNIQPSTVIQGLSYIMWVKEVDDPASPHFIYAVAHKGNSRFGYQDFDFVCKTANKKFFICNKVNDGTPDSTWEDCLYEMKVKRAPKGNPICLTDRAYSFAEVAAIAYREKFFTSEEGLQHIAKRTAPTNPPVAQTKEAFDASSLLDDAKATSDNIDQMKASCTSKLPFNPLFPSGNPGYEHADAIDESVGDLDEDTENLKERVALAESTAEDLKARNDKLEEKICELKTQLASSLDAQQSFMAVGDKATADLEALNDDTADKVAKKLESKLNNIDFLGTSMVDILAKIDNLENVVSGQSEVVTAGIDRVVNRVDNSNQALSEGIMATNDTLYSYGFASDAASFISIPDSIKALLSAPPGLENTQSHTKDVDLQPKACDYSKRNLPHLMICKCGCGYELQLGQVLHGVGGHDDNRVSQASRGSGDGDRRSALNDVGQVQTSQRGFSIDRAGGAQSAVVRNNQAVHDRVVVSSRDTPQFFPRIPQSFLHPPPTYQIDPTALSQGFHDHAAALTPVNKGPAGVQSSDQHTGLTRKQRKAIKNKEYHAKKKLRLSDPDNLVVASGSGSGRAAGNSSHHTQAAGPPSQPSPYPFIPPSQPSPYPFIPPTKNPFVAPVGRLGGLSSTHVWRKPGEQ